MSGPSKIARVHLERLALVYIRQSSLAQVREHTESTARQYALADEAVRLGWDAAKVLVIDADLGMSGRSAAGRTGFKELVSRVCLGEVGAIVGLEVSRLARSSADLQRLLEFCSLTDTLIIDADGVYDLRSFNDRLLLGLKGTMSEAELHLLAGRLQASKRAASERGTLRLPLPIGYVYDADGQTVLDPDEEVRQAVADVFSAFEAAGSACGVVRAFVHRRFPKRAHGIAWSDEIIWGRLTHSRVTELLANPTYAGAYVFGRHRARRMVDPDGTIRTKMLAIPQEEWAVVLQGHHPAYIRWETFLANTQRLAANCTHHGARPPREGEALLQGIVMCGGCGRRMSTFYPAGKATYFCAESRANRMTTPGCRTVLARTVDDAVAKRLLEVVAPDQIALALAAAEEVSDRRARTTRALELQIERARYEAVRAERAFHHCDPENRLVGRSLEQRWEAKLAAVVEAEAGLAAALHTIAPLPPRENLEALARNLPQLWDAPSTSPRDRKRMLRTLVADVTLRSEPAGQAIHIGIHWRSGAADVIVVHRRPPRRTPADAVALVKRMAESSNEEIVPALIAAGFRSGTGRPFDVEKVRWIRRVHHIRPPRLVASDEATACEIARRLGISSNAIYYWIHHGHLKAYRGPRGRWHVPLSTAIEEGLRKRVASSIHIKLQTQTPVS